MWSYLAQTFGVLARRSQDFRLFPLLELQGFSQAQIEDDRSDSAMLLYSRRSG